MGKAAGIQIAMLPAAADNQPRAEKPKLLDKIKLLVSP